MRLEEFLYNKQYKRKIAVPHYLMTKKAFLFLSAFIIYYLFFRSNTKYDAFAYLGLMLYALNSYNKTKLIYEDKINMNKNRNIWLYRIVAKAKLKSIKSKKKEMINEKNL